MEPFDGLIVHVLQPLEYIRGLKSGQASIRCLVNLMAPHGQESVSTGEGGWFFPILSSDGSVLPMQHD